MTTKRNLNSANKQIRLLVIILFLVYIDIAVAQDPPPTPVLKEFNYNQGSNDIDILNCNSFKSLKFSAQVFTSFGKIKSFKWILYKNNVEINKFSSGAIFDCDNTIFVCEKPASPFFVVDAEKGEYRIDFLMTTYKKVCSTDSITCSYIPLFTISKSSNTITVNRFDDAFACKCETPDDLIVDCFGLDTVHLGISSPSGTTPKGPFEARAKNTLQANCNIASNGENVTFRAGQKITLGQGFRSGNNFRAVLDQCFDGIVRKKEDIESSIDSVSANYSNSREIETPKNNPTSIPNSTLKTQNSKFQNLPQPLPWHICSRTRRGSLQPNPNNRFFG